MLEPLVGWGIGVCVCLIIGMVAAFRYGAEIGMGLAVASSLLLPVWLRPEFLGIPFSVRTVVSGIVLGVYALRFPNRIPVRLTILDLVIISLFVVHSLSDAFHGERWLSPAIAYGEWMFPYLAGRYALRGGHSLGTLARYVSVIVVVMSLGGMVECATSVNPWEIFFGERQGGFPRNNARFGFKRAFGNTVHPIFYGLELLALLPWTMCIQSGLGMSLPKGVRWMTLLWGVFGVCASISRAPILAVVLMLLIGLMIREVWARWTIGIAALVIGAVIAVNPVGFLTEVGRFVGEKPRATELRGDKIETNGTLSRLWLFPAYAPALRQGGLLGYGTDAVESFPVNVPKLPLKAKTIKEFQYVDNAYILMGLRFGWLGAALLMGWFAAAVVVGAGIARQRDNGTFGLWAAASIAATAFALLTVWLSYDFGFILLWMSGALSGAASRTSRDEQEYLFDRSW